jgi:hypothetical protein
VRVQTIEQLKSNGGVYSTQAPARFHTAFGSFYASPIDLEVAGLRWGAGVHKNSLVPKRAAAMLSDFAIYLASDVSDEAEAAVNNAIANMTGEA